MVGYRHSSHALVDKGINDLLIADSAIGVVK
jgi:hypothetical protein